MERQNFSRQLVKGWTDEDLASLKNQNQSISEVSDVNSVEPATSSSVSNVSNLPTKGIIFYTDNLLDSKIADAVFQE